MEPGRFLELKVTGSAGQPIGGLRVKRVIPNFYDLLTPKENFAGDTARIAIPLQRFMLEVSADGYDLVELGPFDPATVPEQLACILSALPGIDGRVLADGKPLAGALVSAYSPSQFYAQWHGLPSRLGYKAITSGLRDGEGRFNLSVRETGDLVLMVSADGYAPLEHGPFPHDPRTGADSLELRTTTGGAIRGKVLSRSGGTAAGAIVAVNRGDNHARTQRTDDQGGFFFERLTPGPGTWRLALTSPGPLGVQFVQTVQVSAEGFEWNLALETGLLPLENRAPGAQVDTSSPVRDREAVLALGLGRPGRFL